MHVLLLKPNVIPTNSQTIPKNGTGYSLHHLVITIAISVDRC